MKFLLLLIMMAPLAGFAQSDTAIKYSEVVRVDSATKDQLFQRARAWFNDAFKSSKDVIEIQDKETGEIAGKGNITGTVKWKAVTQRVSKANFSFPIKIYVKDGRYKYEIGEFTNDLTNYSSEGALGVITSAIPCPFKFPKVKSQSYMDGLWQSAKQSLLPQAETLIASLKQSMDKPAIADF